jgi:two-component system cell cycle sensor histidine kinase/response regulator CckA
MNQGVEILIAEDSPTQSAQLQHILESHGYRVAVAQNGRHALALMRGGECAPALVVSDIVMPEMDGYTLCGEIKRDERLMDIPVILLTSLSDSNDIIRGLECGADNFLTKPYDERMLLSRVRYILLNREVRREGRTQMGMEIVFGGQRLVVTPERQQILDLLISTYEMAVQKNLELQRVQEELRTLNESLEEKVEERTAELVREIAERKLGEEALRASEEQLRQSQKLESVGQLAGGIAHDFNNLLTVINGNSDLLLRRLDDEQQRERVEEIKKAGGRAAQLTRQLLAFSRKQMLQPVVLNLNHVVPDVGKMLRRLIGEDIDLMTALDPELGQVNADPGQIEQVLMNLAINARDAMPKGGKLTIQTANVYLDESYVRTHAAAKPGPHVMLAVSDNGHGMDAETQARIFEPFFTTKEKGKGTGLGLSTVYGIVKQSGGDIWVYSEVGRGTTFKIYLPCVEEAAEPHEQAAPQASTPQGFETVLLVEDDEIVRKLAREILELNGYGVLAAADGGEALSLCERHEGPIHLLLTDVVMPQMSGREVAEQAATLRPAMKVLYMSGYTDDSIIHHGVLDAGVAFLEKPFTPDAMARKVREVLDDPQGAARGKGAHAEMNGAPV